MCIHHHFEAFLVCHVQKLREGVLVFPVGSLALFGREDIPSSHQPHVAKSSALLASKYLLTLNLP